MRLVQFGPRGQERPGLWREERLVDLRKHFKSIPAIGEGFFRDGWIEKIAQVEDPGERLDARLGCPLSSPSKIICLGKNYAEHAQEGGFDIPAKPLLFCKTPNTLNGPYDPIVMPASSGQVDWEVELAVIIGKESKRIAKDAVNDHIAGYTIMNDVSAREAQFSESQWFRGKSFDTFAPMGPAVVTPDEIGDVNNLELTAILDGQVMQSGNTRDLIFDIPTLIEYISRDITLMPGDVISTGTPSGVGIFRDPPVLMQKGSVIECRIEPIGAIKNKCI
jgi:2-keto-4-pentenoate hydratase/2-oxohepta-3-ene-1,7-dioic acid hydratase in catechol pathway